jgi:hypothetical protein
MTPQQLAEAARDEAFARELQMEESGLTEDEYCRGVR